MEHDDRYYVTTTESKILGSPCQLLKVHSLSFDKSKANIKDFYATSPPYAEQDNIL